jgi:hypothetical protein
MVVRRIIHYSRGIEDSKFFMNCFLSQSQPTVSPQLFLMDFDTARLKSNFYHCSGHCDDLLLDAGRLWEYFCDALQRYGIALLIVSLLIAHDPFPNSMGEYDSTRLEHSFCFVRNFLHQCSGFTLGPSSNNYDFPRTLLGRCIHHSCKSRILWYDPYSHNSHTSFQHLMLLCFSVAFQFTISLILKSKTPFLLDISLVLQLGKLLFSFLFGMLL